MQPILLMSNFLEVIIWVIMVFFFTMFVWMFISVFADIFRRRDIGGFSKAIWLLFIFVFPVLGVLIYMIFRPPPSQEEIHAIFEAAHPDPIERVARAHALLTAGAISQAEFDTLKKNALA